jgi:hypothetical protein
MIEVKLKVLTDASVLSHSRDYQPSTVSQLGGAGLNPW